MGPRLRPGSPRYQEFPQQSDQCHCDRRLLQKP
ncbi:hypothetical protein FOPG_17549 [Fusarium oxysporum f. sp. conglutinans race 2 54008]|uniref:Uncharacterized protein n=1 Tax=Fusarium oxysporum f. sp. conglutinans race 2 54008 TaxID=1089457 RepID=X0GSF9_FUSOX|nr:hypothetical protein FOPG_17549 [Fusarium oxysporum f. sp. conglutinans race 2 54008]